MFTPSIFCFFDDYYDHDLVPILRMTFPFDIPPVHHIRMISLQHRNLEQLIISGVFALESRYQSHKSERTLLYGFDASLILKQIRLYS